MSGSGTRIWRLIKVLPNRADYPDDFGFVFVVDVLADWVFALVLTKASSPTATGDEVGASIFSSSSNIRLRTSIQVSPGVTLVRWARRMADDLHFAGNAPRDVPPRIMNKQI